MKGDISMKSKQSLKTRVICSVAALLMTFNLLPLSTMALAADSDPVSVEWVPQQQTEHGIGCVALSAALKNAVQPGGAAAAMIEIALTEQEAAALDWTGATVLAGDLLPEQPETGSAEGNEPEAPQTPETSAEDDVSEKVPEEPAALEDGTTEKTPDESDELQNLPESSDPAVVDEEKGADEEKQDGDGEAEPLAAVPLSTTRADPCQAVLVREALGGAVLRILLSGANLTYQETLTFSAANGDQVVEVTKEDIRVRSYASQSAVPSIFSTPLLTDTDSAALTVPNEAFTILQKLPGRVAISAAQSTVSLDEENGQVIYDIIAPKPVSSEEALSTFTLTWPKELTRPEGALSSSGPDTSGLCVISSGSTALVSLRLPENARMSQVTSATFGLSVSVVLPVSADSGTYEMQMTVEGGAFIRPQEHLQGEMVLSTVNENGETVSASVLVTADQASVPGDEDGYTIEAMNWSGSIILSVSKQVTRIDGELVVAEPKTKNSIRRVALSQQAVDILGREHEQHPDNPILFPSPRTGGYWSPDAVSRVNRKLLEMAGIEEHVRFHDLRHTFATMALSSGVDAKTLSSMLGHFSAGFTLDTYTHITNEMQRGAAEKIGGFMETVTAKPEPEPPDPPEESRCKVIPFERVG